MELELKYNPENSTINVLEDVKNILNQLSECYNSKINDMQNRIDCLEKERALIRKAYLEGNTEGLDFYFGKK